MQVSAELRWFWEGNCPDEITRWFTGGWWTSAPVAVARSDEYFVQTGNTEVGCKLRDCGGSLARETELKAMITRFERNRIELWGKWRWHVPPHAQSVTVRKERQLRLCSASGSAHGSHGELPLDPEGNPLHSAALPEDACQVELTRVRIDGSSRYWWTLGLEAWGDLPSAPLFLARSLDMLNPPVAGGRLRNYPQLLDELLFARSPASSMESALIA